MYTERYMKYALMVMAVFGLAILSRYKGYDVPDRQVLLYVDGLVSHDLVDIVAVLNRAKIENFEADYASLSVRLPLKKRAAVQALLIEHGLPREVGQERGLSLGV